MYDSEEINYNNTRYQTTQFTCMILETHNIHSDLCKTIDSRPRW